MDTGVEKTTCCQPEAVSAVNVAVASNVPLLDQRVATRLDTQDPRPVDPGTHSAPLVQ